MFPASIYHIRSIMVVLRRRTPFTKRSLEKSLDSYRYNFQQNELDKDFRAKPAKTAKKNIFLFLRTWRALPRGIPTRPRSCCSPEALFHRGESSSIRSFPLSLGSICLPRSTRKSRRIYNQIILALRFKARGRYSLIIG